MPRMSYDRWRVFIGNNDLIEVRRGLEQGLNPNYRGKKKRGVPIWTNAIKHGFGSQTAIFLIENGADVNAKDGLGNPVLIRALFEHQPTIFFALVDRVDNVDAQDSDGETALRWSIIKDFPGVIEKLLEKGANHLAKLSNGKSIRTYTLEIAGDSPSDGDIRLRRLFR